MFRATIRRLCPNNSVVHCGDVVTKAMGVPGTTEWHLRFSKIISPWHDIPLTPSLGPGLLHYVNEIPLGTTEKYEIQTTLEHNPIKQDTKKGQLRHLTYKGNGCVFNYGALPQTWEPQGKGVIGPFHDRYGFGFDGDGDPVDVVEASPEPLELGGVSHIRVLGSLGLIDEGEMDWKVIAISNGACPTMFMECKTLDDLRRLRPGFLEAVHDWFNPANYKTDDSKPKTELLEGGKLFDAAFTLAMIDATHIAYSRLQSGAIP
eukprot:PhM_4_TR9824/c1_g1_i4/m.73420/K01507/ppa; inorganic pyrophosphatase